MVIELLVTRRESEGQTHNALLLENIFRKFNLFGENLYIVFWHCYNAVHLNLYWVRSSVR